MSDSLFETGIYIDDPEENRGEWVYCRDCKNYGKTGPLLDCKEEQMKKSRKIRCGYFGRR